MEVGEEGEVGCKHVCGNYLDMASRDCRKVI